MKQVACPHCGFQNFAISAYCGRCERPLNHDRTPVPRDPPSAPLPIRPGRSTRPSRPKPQRPQRPTLVPRPGSGRAKPPRAPPPAPPPPTATTNLTPAPLPIELKLPEPELPRDVLRESADATRAANADATTIEPPPPPLSTLPPVEPEEIEPVEIDVPVSVTSGLRLGLTWFVDACVIMSFGVLSAFLEILVFDGVWTVEAAHPLDVAAYWVNANSGPALHGVVVAGLFAFAYNFMAAKYGGRTVGRLVSGTVLVRASGRRLAWPLVLFRSVVGTVSLLTFGAGFFWSIIDTKNRTWHDLLSGTVLVRRHVEPPA